MAIDLAARYVVRDVEQATAPTSGSGATQVHHGPFTGIVICDGHQWSAICRELDVASVGETAVLALDNLQDAVREYIASVLADGGDPAQQRRVPDPDMRDFLLGHQGPEPITYVTFTTE